MLLTNTIKIKYFYIIVVLICVLSGYLSANELNNMALPCQGCHGPDGNSYGETIPSISGLSTNYFKEAFQEYKTGVRRNYVMQIIAKGYTDDQIDKIATFFKNNVDRN